MTSTSLSVNNTLKHVTDLFSRYVMSTYGRAPVVFERGEGPFLWDSEGKQYLDFLAGIAVNSLGHCHPAVVKAIQDQAEKLLHVSNLYMIRQQAELAEALSKYGEMHKAFFCNSGAEANESCLKLARKYGHSFSPDKSTIVAAENSFHGRTMGALAVTGQAKYQKAFTPLIGDVKFVQFNNGHALTNAVDAHTCGIILEPVQGESGVYPADVEYLQLARKLADEYNALLIFDEVQTGIGRTGTFFAWQGYGVKPDALSSAKALGGGMPIGAMLTSEKASNIFEAGDHASTFGGTPIACAAAYATVKTIMSENLCDNAMIMGNCFKTSLEMIGKEFGYKEIRGKGLMLALELEKPIAQEVKNKAFENGLLINAIGSYTLRFLPPLIINQSHIEKASDILIKTIREVVHN